MAKIVVLGSFAESLINFRGPMLQEMVKRGYQVVACAPDASGEIQVALHAMGVEYRDVPIERVGLNPVKDFQSIYSLSRLFRKIKPDIFFGYTVKPYQFTSTLWHRPSARKENVAGSRKYGNRLGTCAELAARIRSQASTHRVFLYGHYREALASTNVAMLKTLKRPVRIVRAFRKTQWIALFSTDLNLSTEQIIEYYGVRWKIESGFKEIKQDIGSSKSQTRNAHAVINHINFSMMAAAVTWIYGARLENIPERRHKVRGRNSFAFSDLRHIIAKAALTHDFDAVCRNHPKSLKKSCINTLLRMVT